MLTEVDLSTEVDLNLEPPCEASFHVEIDSTDSAMYVIKAECPGCCARNSYLIGQQCYVVGVVNYLECDNCDYVAKGREFWKVVSVL